MQRLWLLFAQAVTIVLALYFVYSAMRPDWPPARPGTIQQLGTAAQPASARAGAGSPLAWRSARTTPDRPPPASACAPTNTGSLPAVRSSDTVARLGGDEFVIVAQGLRNVDDATVLAQKMLESFKDRLEVPGVDLLLTRDRLRRIQARAHGPASGASSARRRTHS